MPILRRHGTVEKKINIMVLTIFYSKIITAHFGRFFLKKMYKHYNQLETYTSLSLSIYLSSLSNLSSSCVRHFHLTS